MSNCDHEAIEVFRVDYPFFTNLPVYPLVLTIVLPGVFVMAHLECCCETVTPIFATSTNLPVSDFQTWQVCLPPLLNTISKDHNTSHPPPTPSIALCYGWPQIHDSECNKITVHAVGFTCG